MKKYIAVIIACLSLPACYSSATAARRAQTQRTTGFYCYGSPVISCPNSPNRECTGWDSQWLATCPDSGQTFLCRNITRVGIPGGDFTQCMPYNRQ